MSGHPMPAEAVPVVELSNFSVMAFFLNKDFVANRIAPVIDVNVNPGFYSVILPIEGINVNHETRIPHGGESTELNFRLMESSYATVQYGKKHLVTDRELKMSSRSTLGYRTGVQLILQELATQRERDLANLMLHEANYYSDVENPHWFEAENEWFDWWANPKDDIDRAVRAIRLHSGFTPNTLLLSPRSYDFLIGNRNVQRLIQYTGGIQFLQTGKIPGGMVYNLEIVEAGAVYNAAPPLETAQLGFLWENASLEAGDDWAWVGYVDRNPGIETGAFAVQFAFNNATLSDMDIVTVNRIREELKHGTWYEVLTDYDLKITNNRAGAIITGIGSTS